MGDRYTLVERLGSGGPAAVWRAVDREGDRSVVVKWLPMDQVPDWKAIELFEREVETLASLQHPQIPRYLDSFHLRDGHGNDAAFCLIQEYVAGEDLAAALERGEVFTEREVVELLEQLLGVTAYLHEHSPPVVHRDIKPANLIRRDGEPLALVDLGAVQVVVPESVGGSTIVGTSGYLPVEQLMGRAVPASDIYAIGATALHLLTRTHPSELQVERNQLRFREQVDISDRLARFLDRATAPAAEDRFADAGEALRVLRGETAPDSTREPGEARVGDVPVEVDGRIIDVDDPPEWLELDGMSRDQSVYHFSPRDRPDTAVRFRRTTLQLSGRLIEIETTSPFGRNSLFALGAAVLAIAAVEAWFLLFVPILLAIAPPETIVRIGRDGLTRKSGLTVRRTVDEAPLDRIARFDADEGLVRAIRRDGSEIPITDGLDVEQAEWLAELLNGWLRRRLPAVD